MDLAGNIASAAAGAGAAAAALVTWRKAGAESESVAVSTMRLVIGELRDELDRKEEELRALRQRVDAAEQALQQAITDPPPHLA